MGSTIFTSKTILGLLAGLFLLLAGGLYFYGAGTPAGEGHTGFLPGEWEVTQITGQINTKVAGGSAWCEAMDQNSVPIVDREQTFIRFIPMARKLKTEHIRPEVYDTLNLLQNPEGVFIFQFTFENGPQGNTVLEPFEAPYHYTELIGGLWSFELGCWGDADQMEFSQSGSVSNTTGPGMVLIGEVITGNKWGGKSSFRVSGKLIGPDRIEGTWWFEGTTSGPVNIPECKGESFGQGNWVAVRR